MRRLGEQRLRLDQDLLAAALEPAVQALAVAARQVLLLVEQRLAARERVGVALLQELGAQLVQSRAFFVPIFFTAAFALSSKPGSRPYRWLKRRATSRVNSTCGTWSSPTGTYFAR